MRNLQVITISLFLAISIAFTAFFCYDRMMVDHTAPKIYCDGAPLYVSVSATDDELCAGLTAHDDVDGDITDRIVVRKVSQLIGNNVASISYAVFDSSSNICTFNRYVFYNDYQKPRFHLEQPLIYGVNSTISLADRLTASDSIDGDLSGRIRVDSTNLTNTTTGQYTLPVRVTNSSGDTSNINLTILIQNITSRHPVIHLSDYLIYLEPDAELTDEDLRNMIVSARTSSAGTEISPEDVTINNLVDTSRKGSYDVSYSYTNNEGLTYLVILTVVVE